MRPKMYTEATSVSYGMFPVMITSAPNSPTAFANASATPERMPGRMFGKTIRRNVVADDAPSECAAPSSSGQALEHGLDRADDERKGHEHQREHDRDPRERESTPISDFGP